METLPTAIINDNFIINILDYGNTQISDSMKIMATTLVDKQVMSSDGEILGTVENLLADTKNGNIDAILINPTDSLEGYELNKDGKLLIPFKNIKSIRDVVIVEVKK